MNNVAFQIYGTKKGPSSLVTIGTQIWTTRNLDVSTYRNGDVIPQVTDATVWGALTTGAWCYYENNTANGLIYGKLYNWHAVNDSRGLAPVGYHIPTNAEVATLSNYVGGVGGASVAGGRMKSTGNLALGTGLWTSPNTGATNSTGFTALPGGYAASDFMFYNSLGNDTYLWASSQANTLNGICYFINYNFPNLGRTLYDKKGGFSVRLIKD